MTKDILTHRLLGNFACFLSSADFCFKIDVSKTYLMNAIRVSNGLDPDKAQHLFAKVISRRQKREQS